MLELIATIKLLALIGYSFLFYTLVRSSVPFLLKLHFGLYLFGLGSWQLTSFMLTINTDAATAVFLCNLSLAAAGLQSVTFFPLTRVFLARRRLRSMAAAAYVCSVGMVFVGLLQLGVNRVVAGQAGYFIPVFGPVVYVLTLISYFFWGSGISLLIVGLRRERLRLQRNRIGYVLVGAIIVLAGSATNFTPLQAYPVDTVCTLINALLVSYAVTRYRLIDTGTILKRSLTVMAIMALGVGGYILFSVLAGLLVRPYAQGWGIVSGLAGFIMLLVLTILLGWKSIRPIVDRLAAGRKVSYDRILQTFTQETRQLLDVKKLKMLLISTASEAIGSDRGCLLLHARESASYAVSDTSGSWTSAQAGFSMTESDDFVSALKDRKFPLWEQELMIDPGLEYMRAAGKHFFEGTDASIAVPLIHEDSVLGIICLGSRSSQGLYGTEDLRFLSTLANVATTSIAIAFNYREIEHQLSIQTFLFVLSESLVRHVGSKEAIRSAISILQSFLDLEECFLLTLEGTGDCRVHATRDLLPREEHQLRQVGRALAAGKGRRGEDARFTGALLADTLELPGSDTESTLVRSLLYLPLTSGAGWIGILALDPRHGEGSADITGAVSGAFKAILSQGLLAIRHVSELRSLKEYNEKILVSVSTSGEMLLVMDSKGTIVRSNSATSDLLGFGEGELVGMGLRQLVDPDSSAGIVESFLRTAPGRVVQNCEMQFRTKSDRRMPVLVSSANIVDAENTTQEVVVLARDISRLRDAERGLEESEWRYRSLFEDVLDVVVAFRDDGELLDVNPAGRRLFGLGTGGSSGDWNLPRDFFLEPPRFAALQAELAAHGSIKDFELRLRTPEGGARVVLFTGGMDERSPVGRRVIHGIMRDVTEQRELQRQLLQAQKMESIGTLAGGIAHDFNNILTATLGYALLIRREIDDKDAVLSHLQILEASARRAVDLTRRLLSFARAGVSDRKPVRVNEIVLEAVQLLRRTFDRSIEIMTDCAADLPPVIGDQGQIHQILINLCVNARDAMPGGGTLSLRTRSDPLPPDGEEYPLGVSGRGSVVLEVSDTGSGIAREVLPKIFDPFFTTKGPGEGTGLGLSIVYGIVKQHGGQVRVSSDLGRGTTFTVLFPATEWTVTEPGSAPGHGAEPRGKETILIVDDEPTLRSLVRISLSERGYTILEAGDGLEALELYSQHAGKIDMVLIDLVMPKLGGRETYLKLKQMNPGVRALFATGYGIDDQVQELLATGVMGIIKKPYEMTSVESEIRKVLDQGRR
jgi:two-component system cell cycle sensor histidine kinase/response regulator CckA